MMAYLEKTKKKEKNLDIVLALDSYPNNNKYILNTYIDTISFLFTTVVLMDMAANHKQGFCKVKYIVTMLKESTHTKQKCGEAPLLSRPTHFTPCRITFSGFFLYIFRLKVITSPFYETVYILYLQKT